MPTDDGPDPTGNYKLTRRGKRFDYFTSSLPWPQKSDAGSVTLPLGSSAPVVIDLDPADDVDRSDVDHSTAATEVSGALQAQIRGFYFEMIEDYLDVPGASAGVFFE